LPEACNKRIETHGNGKTERARCAPEDCVRTKSVCFLLPATLLALLVLSLPACRDRDKPVGPGMSVQALFANRCTPCHGWEEAARIHGSEESVLQLIRRMRSKGAVLTDAQAMNIAGFLSAPNRHMFESRCTKCHPMDTVILSHETGKMTLDTIRRMRRKKGADISVEDAEAIREYLIRYYFAAPD